MACDAYAKGADCSASGSTLASLRTTKGYWRATASTGVFHRCSALTDACVGGTIVNGTRDTQCAHGHTGPLCDACSGGLVRGISGRCTTCTDTEGPGKLAIVVVLLILLGGVIALALRS